MTFNRGQVWLANLNPTQGSEQSGTRPVIVFQNNIISKFSTTIITIPLTTNLRRAKFPSSLFEFDFRFNFKVAIALLKHRGYN